MLHLYDDIVIAEGGSGYCFLVGILSVNDTTDSNNERKRGRDGERYRGKERKRENERERGRERVKDRKRMRFKTT